MFTLHFGSAHLRAFPWLQYAQTISGIVVTTGLIRMNLLLSSSREEGVDREPGSNRLEIVWRSCFKCSEGFMPCCLHVEMSERSISSVRPQASR